MPRPTHELSARAEAAPRRVLVVAAFPTPNGDLHLGHLSGPYLRADVYARALRLRGVDTRYLTGTDDHQSYVALRAERRGEPADATAGRFAGEIGATLAKARIRADRFDLPREPRCTARVEAFVAALHQAGELVVRDAPALFCPTCAEFVFEAYVSGACPHCGAGAGGGGCEACGLPNDCADLGEPRCGRCGGTPSVRSYPRLFFPLARHEARLREFWASVPMSPPLAALCERARCGGLGDVAVSHLAGWGIPVPVPGLEGQRLSASVELVARLLGAAGELAESGGWEAFWKDPEARVVPFFGFDNGFFYAVFLPALLLAYDPGIRLPAALVCNEFLRLDGLKFSTSRGHAIWGGEFLARVPADLVRFHLAIEGPETEQTNFAAAEFARTVRRELLGGWREWLVRLGDAVRGEFGGAAPAPGPWTHEHRELLARLRRCTHEVEAAYRTRTFSPSAAARGLGLLVAETRRFAAAEAHWRGLPVREGERRTGIALELAAARSLALLSAPLMPDFAAALWRDLGYDVSPEQQGWEGGPALPRPGQPVALGTPGAATAAVFAAWEHAVGTGG